MPLPDPYADETTVELDQEIYRLWLQAKANAVGWAKEVLRLQNRLTDQLGEAHAGVINGEKVVYYRPQESWAVARLIKENPDLAQHYMHEETKEVFDLEQFRKVHRQIADKYRIRSFRSAE